MFIRQFMAFSKFNHRRATVMKLILFVHVMNESLAFYSSTENVAIRRHNALCPPLHYLSNPEDLITIHDDRRAKTKRSLLHQFDRILTDWQTTRHHLRDRRFLTGNYAPVAKENVAVDVEVVEGEIPRGIWGTICRNGPNPVREWQRKRYHWFDGHAMLHVLMIKDGKATYTNQFVPSPRYRIEEELDEEYFPTIGEYNGLLGLIKLIIHPQMVKEKIDDIKMVAPPNTNVLLYNNKLYCLHEACLPMECRMHRDGRLDYVGYETFDGVLDYPVSAHPVKDGSDLLFHSYSVDRETIDEHGTMKVGIHRSKTNNVETYFVPTSDKSHVSFAHSLMYTDNYIIIWDSSVHFQQDALIKGGSFFRHNQKYNLKFGLIPKNATSHQDVVWIDSGEPGAIVHPLHAWEEVEERFLNGNMISQRTVIKLWTPWSQEFKMELEEKNSFPMMEFTIDIDDKSVLREVIDDTINTEFAIMPSSTSPRYSSSKNSQSNCKSEIHSINGRDSTSILSSTLSNADRYGFSSIFEDTKNFVGYAKWDMMNASLADTVYYREDEVGGETVIFRGDDQDVLYVGSHVYNNDEDQSYFVLYDAESSQLLCRLKMPQRVPFGFHGIFISGEELESHFVYHEG